MTDINIKILVAYHKKSMLFKNSILTPVFVGKAVYNAKDSNTLDLSWLNERMIGDDTGDNISLKNKLYAEYTALYWAYKNLEKIGNPDYIGIFHYRRLLNFSDKIDGSVNFDDEQIKKICRNYDIILSEPLGAWSKKNSAYINQIYSQYCIEHYKQDIDLFIEIVLKRHPEYKDSLNSILYNRKKISWYNIFIMKKEFFVEYMKISYCIFSELENKLENIVRNNDQSRVIGFIGEIFLNVYIDYLSTQKKLHIGHLPLYKADSSAELENIINICYCTDNNYVRYTATSIVSLILNSYESTGYHVHIISDGLNKKNKRKLETLIQLKNFRLSFHYIDSKKLNLFEKIKRPKWISISAYMRLFIPDLLKNIKKAVYIDSDTLILCDLHQLINCELEENWIGGVQDINNVELAKKIKLPDSKYINSGVLLIDCEKCRQNNYLDKLKEAINRNSNYYTICDQDLINDAFHNEIKYISYKYNMYFTFHKLRHNFNPSDLNDYIESCKKPAIIHFVGADKPWKEYSNHDYKLLYNYYLSLTPWFSEVKMENLNLIKKTMLFSKYGNEGYKELRFLNLPIAKVFKNKFQMEKRLLGLRYHSKKTLQSGVKIINKFGIFQILIYPKDNKKTEIKKLSVFGIPVADVNKNPLNITKKIFGFPYYIKSDIGNDTKEVVKFGFLVKRYKVQKGKIESKAIIDSDTSINHHTPSIDSNANVHANNSINENDIFNSFFYVISKRNSNAQICMLLKSFAEKSNDSRLHFLYIHSLLLNNNHSEFIEEVEIYIKRFGGANFGFNPYACYLAARHGLFLHEYCRIPEMHVFPNLYEKMIRNNNSLLLNILLNNQSIAVVGNGPSQIGKKTGREIDSHDVVIRFNNYCTESDYSIDYGSKTDIWVVGSVANDIVYKNLQYKAVVFAQDIRVCWFTNHHICSYIMGRTDIKIPCLFIEDKIIDSYRKHLKLDFTTSGANLIFLLHSILGNFKNVSFYGFNFQYEKPDNFSSHYFNENQSIEERKLRSSSHDMVAEAKTLKDFIDNNK